MKAKPADFQRAMARPGETRLFLLHGPDEAGSRALVGRLGAAMGAGAERVDLKGADLKDDPARLADEAAAISMFGDARWILVEQAGDESVAAVEALLAAPVTESAVIAIGGALRKTSALLKHAESHRAALTYPSSVPEGQ